MAPQLVAEDGILKGLVLNLTDKDTWTVGRDPDSCDFVIEDLSVSRTHVVLTRSGDDIRIENLSETNPARLNGEEILEPTLLTDGDSIAIGTEIFRFYSSGETQVFIDEDSPTKKPSRASIFEHRESVKKGPELAEINFDVTETGRWLLKVINGPNNGAEFAMQTGNVYLIGTDPNTCDVVFHDNSVSRQHSRITITNDDTVIIEDLGSRNGTLIDGERLEGKQSLEPNMLVTLGTTSFVIFDREGEMQTIISPLLPQIVRSLQEKKVEEDRLQAEKEKGEQAEQAPPPEPKRNAGAFILIAIITGIFVVAGIGITTLFSQKPIDKNANIDIDQELKNVLSNYPEVRYQYTPSTGRLLLIGHTLTQSDETRMTNALNELPFVNQIDKQNVVIDEYLWREINQVLARDPQWRGIAIHAPKPGQFVISGYLQTRKEGERLGDYLNANFPFLDLLENRVVVEENVIRDVNTQLESAGFNKVLAQMSNGELTLAGTIPGADRAKFDALVVELRKIPGLRNVRSYVTDQTPQEAIVNISDKYEVSGVTRKGNVNTNVVINGRVLGIGDALDGRTITSIEESSIFLKKDGVIYRIDFNR
jgi:type III secretion system YscD/HrpQ family protein